MDFHCWNNLDEVIPFPSFLPRPPLRCRLYSPSLRSKLLIQLRDLEERCVPAVGPGPSPGLKVGENAFLGSPTLVKVYCCAFCYQTPILRHRAAAAHQMYTTGSVVEYTRYSHSAFSSTPPLIFTEGQKV